MADRLEPSVPVDPWQTVFDARLREAGADERMRIHARMHRDAFLRVWAQVDRAGPMSELETARFVLRRLYPDLEGPRLDSMMARLTDEFAAGTWSGLTRPSN
jgi:hypothetical protein